MGQTLDPVLGASLALGRVCTTRQVVANVADADGRATLSCQMPDQLRVAQHAVPRHVLARFANDDGRLTVIRREPALKLLRNQAPENVGIHNHLNNWRDESGRWNDELEAGPLDRLDGAGGDFLQRAHQFAIDAAADVHPRFLDWELEERAGLQLCVAGLMVRTVSFRGAVDSAALPSLLTEMSARLEDRWENGQIGKTEYELLRRTFATDGRVRVVRPPNWHLELLVPLIESVATQIHLDTLVAVRRFNQPLLLTGTEPVVLFPTADCAAGVSLGEMLGASEHPIEPWRPKDVVLQQISERLHASAGLAVAIDPWTLLMMFNADTDDGGKLAWMTAKVAPDGLAGVVNVNVAKGSIWLAGRDDCEMIRIISAGVSDA